MKRCTKCHQEKPLDDFNLRRGKPMARCKPCHSEDAMASHARRRAKDPERFLRIQKNGQLRHQFGMTVDEYDRLHAEQGGLCAICGLPETRIGTHGKVRMLSVDHDHDTGDVRRLLCGACNAMIGLAREDPKILESAIRYVTTDWSGVDWGYYTSEATA